MFIPRHPADAPNNPSRRPDAPCNPSSGPGTLITYHVRQAFSTTHLIGRTSPATHPFDQTSHTTSPVGRMSYDLLLAFDRLPETFPHLLNLQNLQLATRRRAHSCASWNHLPDRSRRGSHILSAADHSLRPSALLQFYYFRASGHLCYVYFLFYYSSINT